MHISSPIRRKHARIEIIPLIDVMFFLLASFMMVSLNMTKIENILVTLPAAAQVQEEFGPDMIHVAVDKDGKTWVAKQPITLPDLYTVMTNRFRANPKVPVYIGGDAGALHGDMVAVLDMVRRAGIQKVAFTVTEAKIPAAGGTPP